MLKWIDIEVLSRILSRVVIGGLAKLTELVHGRVYRQKPFHFRKGVGGLFIGSMVATIIGEMVGEGSARVYTAVFVSGAISEKIFGYIISGEFFIIIKNIMIEKVTGYQKRDQEHKNKPLQPDKQ